MPGSAKLYSENRRINGRMELESPISRLESTNYSGVDTYISELPNKCKILKEDRDLLRITKEEMEEQLNAVQSGNSQEDPGGVDQTGSGSQESSPGNQGGLGSSFIGLGQGRKST